MPPQAPDQYGQTPGPINYINRGYGPVNYQNQAPDPFSQLDDYINYQNLVKQAEVEQYQQAMQMPLQMTQRQLFQAVNYPRFQFGVDATARETMYRTFQRRNDLQRTQYSSRLASEAIQWGAGAAMFGGVSAAFGGGVLGVAAGVALPVALLAPLGMSVDAELQRREFASNISTDLDLYRRRVGGNFTYQQNTQLGRQLQREMYRGQYQTPEQRRNEFFTAEQQMGIFKTGLASGLLDTKNQDVETMLSARGGRMDQGVVQAMQRGGTTQQFQRNFEMLRDTTRDVVKLLQTTVEGGMSVIKELQQTGFRSIGDIRNQVIQAKAFGDITGVGAQNMMLIGRAGAQAVQGTGWSAQAGAQMYQQAATTAALQAQVSPSMARAVERAGGIGQAGAALAGAQMNMLNSGMGTRVVAAMLRPDGTIDPNAMTRMRSGQMTAGELSSRANNVGYAMGVGGRAMFDLTRQRALEQMTDIDRQMLVQKSFDAWRGNKMGNAEQQAWVFAGMWTNNPAERELMMQNMMQGKQYDKQWAAINAQRGGLNAPSQAPYVNAFSRNILNPEMSTIGKAGGAFGAGFVDYSNMALGGAMQTISKARLGTAVWGANILEQVFNAKEFNSYGGISRVPQVSAQEAYDKAYGVNMRVTGEQLNALAYATPAMLTNIEKFRTDVSLKDSTRSKRLSGLGINTAEIYGTKSVEQLTNLQNRLLEYKTGVLDVRKIEQDVGAKGLFGLLGMSDIAQQTKFLQQKPDERLKTINESLVDIVQFSNNASKKRETTQILYEQSFKGLSKEASIARRGATTGLLNKYAMNKELYAMSTIEEMTKFISGGSLTGMMTAQGGVRADEAQAAYIASELFARKNIGKSAIMAEDLLTGSRDVAGAERAARVSTAMANKTFWKSKSGKLYDKLSKLVGQEELIQTLAAARAPGADLYNVVDQHKVAAEAIARDQGIEIDKAGKWRSNPILTEKMAGLAAVGGAATTAAAESIQTREAVKALNITETAARVQVAAYNEYARSTGAKQLTTAEQTALTLLRQGDGALAKLKDLGMNPAQLKKLVQGVTGGYFSDPIKDSKGAPIDTWSNLIQQSQTLFSGPQGAAFSAAQQYGQQAGQIAQLSAEAAKYSKMAREGTWGWDEKTKKSISPETSAAKAAALATEVNMLNTNLNIQKEGMGPTPTGQMSASVAPPVLNYWNNRWVL